MAQAPADAPRYPIEALMAATGLSMTALGRLVGCSGTTLQDARQRGLSALCADRYAVRAGYHPYEVWPEMLERDMKEKDDNQRTRDNAAARRRYQGRPDVREVRRTSRRAYYEAFGDYERARERAKYWSDPEAARARRRARYRRKVAAARESQQPDAMVA